ncbi:lytic murein transglycosylase [Lichenihabitans sp. Uapishka_5]|uniref:lytic murein transglycosylase n=1 Tax=Lichenihabitans sp. Uapishka_5 TaxID=3037302 RepID=UPI0029E7CB50|nr:lytic murein transglycosylase [Lichenihabitans sp. Uapishka_5]MDX7953108.1 lytic murein transglycosylase [Lichenihabitans sp. Uapishka_5]
MGISDGFEAATPGGGFRSHRPLDGCRPGWDKPALVETKETPMIQSGAWSRGGRLGTVILLTLLMHGPAVAAPDLPAFVAGLWPAAARQGIPRPLFDGTFAGVTLDPTLAPLIRAQPEFAKPIGAYLQAQVTPGRIAQGRAVLATWHDVLAGVAADTGVPAATLVAIWGLETNYGTASGSKDVIRSLATLGALGWRPELMRDELLAALTLLKDGAVARAQLRGSWAGAMGQPQFMPSSFAKYAVDGDRDGRRDIWTDVPDALASMANFLKQQGWQAGQPWGFEVRLPPNFDMAQAHGGFADWAARGLVRADGGALPGAGDATLFFPAGAAGPAFLVTANYPVIKTYNFSDAYVLSVVTLADRIGGGAPLHAAWPNDPGLPRAARISLQARLAALGYPVDNREGRISLGLRDTIRAAQAKAGLVPDGNPDAALLRALPAP